jgi:hypothetical protein
MNGDACGRDDNVEGQINSFVSVFMQWVMVMEQWFKLKCMYWGSIVNYARA